jgi:hypothetical protein
MKRDVGLVFGLICWLYCKVFDTKYLCVFTIHAPYITLPPLYNQFSLIPSTNNQYISQKEKYLLDPLQNYTLIYT